MMKVFKGIYLSVLLVLFLAGIFACAQNPTNLTKKSYDKGIEHATQGEFQKAGEEFEKALEFDPFFTSAEFNLKIIKDVIEQKIKKETAVHLFNGISSAGKGRQDNTIGVSYARNALYLDAIREYNLALEINPKYVETYRNRGLVYKFSGQDDRAVSDFNSVLEINPKDADAYVNQGSIYARNGYVDQAISDLNKALEINPNHAEAYYSRGFANFIKHHKQGPYDQAIKDYTRAIEINPKYAEAYRSRGAAYYSNGEYNQADNDYSKLIEINPKDTEAYYSRGLLYFDELGNKGKGCADFKKACNLGLGRCGNYYSLQEDGVCR